ncbi:inner membrane protein YbaN [Methanobrevibacter filiformis]|uniref:Inner membrane protein YbaN n=2 Tax=Methanobrevibacter filiformis TaxID=55758 RepID=A0A165ZTT9_9EURY|nr:inner membrane protein YbaN [Methanobrevibacter filiformis]
MIIMNIKRSLFLTVGSVSLSLGVIGIVIPVLPTTPFILISAFCFANSSKRAEKWLLSNKYFRIYIENYRNKTGIPKSLKIQSISFLWIMLILSMLITRNILIAIVLVIVGICVTIHLYIMKTKIE